MGEPLSLVITILNPNTPNIEQQAVSIHGRIVDQFEPDQYSTVYLLADPSGGDDSILRVTVDAGPDSESRE